jgi:hypothetical protein
VEVTVADGEPERENVADTDAVAVAVRLLVELDVCKAAGAEGRGHRSWGDVHPRSLASHPLSF